MRETPTARESKTLREVPRVRDVMRRNFPVVGPDVELRDVARTLLKKSLHGAAVVDEEGRFEGFISTQGLMLALVDFLNEERPVGPVRSYLDPDPPRLAEDSSLMEAVDAFARSVRANLVLPVLEGERLVGVVTRLDVVRGAMDYFTGEKDMRPGTLYLSALKDMEEKPPFER